MQFYYQYDILNGRRDAVLYNGTYYATKVNATTNLNKQPDTQPTYWQNFAMGFKTPVAYNALDTYLPGDIVTRTGSTYYNIATSTGIAPPNATYWILIASKGDTGATGTGFPTGGLANQVLVKNSGTDYDTIWSNTGAADSIYAEYGD